MATGYTYERESGDKNFESERLSTNCFSVFIQAYLVSQTVNISSVILLNYAATIRHEVKRFPSRMLKGMYLSTSHSSMVIRNEQRLGSQ